ncbi:ABC transporter permease [Rhodobacter ferrooxidans]|uniref:Binding-protein-dependent transport systems inner membrane component n=1 Tax=Rhodobacter ferrooxidans TaxID=371731 RepID=C8RZG4_9RHOB|nr:ABC transporter permease [Rhodobacter sp. SW2]EEW25761.1 binding-protein-dependent transport systems inner membrane component [Rhodobacter sp. SW2]
MNQSRAQRWVLGFFVLLALVMLSAPTVVVMGASVSAGRMIAFPPEGFSLQWYGKILAASDLRQAFGRTLVVALICTAVALPVGTLAGIALAKFRLRFAGAVQVYLLLPFTVPLIGSGIGMMLAFGKMGILGQLWPVGIACAVINLPFMIWAVTASAAALDPDLELAAANCGAGRVQTFLSVTLPAVTPGIITGSLLMFILAMNEFLVSLLLVDARIVTLPVQIYNSIRSIITPDLAAISVVFIVMAALAIALLDWLVGLDIFLKSK